MNRIRGLVKYPTTRAGQEAALTRRSPFTGIVWTADRNRFLRENYSRMTALQLAAHFGTTRGAIYRQANKLELFRYAPALLAAD